MALNIAQLDRYWWWLQIGWILYAFFFFPDSEVFFMSQDLFKSIYKPDSEVLVVVV